MSRTRLSIALTATTMALVSSAAGTGIAGAGPSPHVSIVTPITERLLLADTVAASKWVTRSAIDDPVRERAVLDAAARSAPSGVDPSRVRVVVRDQIEASKTVQRALFARWRAVPRTAPRTDPTLTVVRARISELTAEIVTRLAENTSRRGDTSCVTTLASTTLRTVSDRRLDPVHTAALLQAERSICRL